MGGGSVVSGAPPFPLDGVQGLSTVRSLGDDVFHFPVRPAVVGPERGWACLLSGTKGGVAWSEGFEERGVEGRVELGEGRG